MKLIRYLLTIAAFLAGVYFLFDYVVGRVNGKEEKDPEKALFDASSRLEGMLNSLAETYKGKQVIISKPDTAIAEVLVWKVYGEKPLATLHTGDVVKLLSVDTYARKAQVQLQDGKTGIVNYWEINELAAARSIDPGLNTEQ